MQKNQQTDAPTMTAALSATPQAAALPAAAAAAAAAGCPFHGAGGDVVASTMLPSQRLLLPMARRLVMQYAAGERGPELRLYHDRQEICFDDPAQFAFGETLARQQVFTAADATAWGRGYGWPLVQSLLQDLVDAGVLQTLAMDEPAPAPRPPGQDLTRPSPLPPAPCALPRSWHDSERLFQQLTGRALDPAWLEVVVPIFRVAHMSVDAEGRQVGEANVFPPALRLEVPTRWRTCIYDGTRHLSDKPMNVAALKSMRTHWPAMMILLRLMREAYLERYPEAVVGWTVGHLERLATAVLALPTWQLMRARAPVANGQLHPALSSLFRVTDGLRMVMHQMLFVPVGEPARDPHHPVTAADVLAYAERNYAFHSDHGVCAGPQAMVQEFLAVLVDGRPPRDGWADGLPDGLDDAVASLGDALTYGLRGLQTHAVTFSMWPQMVRGYELVAAALDSMVPAGSAVVQAWRQRMQAHLQQVRASSYLATEAWRTHRDTVYADMLAQCNRGVGDAPGLPLASRLQPWQDESDAAAEAGVDAALLQALGPGVPRQALVHAVMDHLCRTRSLLAEVSRVQGALNAHLGRSTPVRELEATDLDLHNQLLGAARRPLPFLIDELQSMLGLTLTVTATMVDVASPIGRQGAGRDPAHPVRDH